MSFMQQQILHGLWIEIDGNCGIDALPADLVSEQFEDGDSFSRDDTDDETWERICDAVKDYTENTRIRTISARKGYGARLSAPGYMDCTSWSVCDTEQEAREYLEEMYGDDSDDTED